MLSVTYSTVDFGDLSPGKDSTKNISADSKPVYFYLKLFNTDVNCKISDFISCDEGEAIEQAITNNTIVSTVDGGQSGNLSAVYEALKNPRITVTQGDSIINPFSEYDIGAILQNTIHEITFIITNSGEENLTFVNNTNGNRCIWKMT